MAKTILYIADATTDVTFLTVRGNSYTFTPGVGKLINDDADATELLRNKVFEEVI